MSIQATSKPIRESVGAKPCGMCGGGRNYWARGEYCTDCLPAARELGWAPPKAPRNSRNKKVA